MNAKLYYRFGRLLWTVICVVAGMNLQSWATRHGYSDMLTGHFDPMTWDGVFAFATNPIVTHATAFLAGWCVFSWLALWVERLDGSYDGPPRWAMLNAITSVRMVLESGSDRWSAISVGALVERTNPIFERLRLPPIPIDQMDDADRRKFYGQYARTVEMLLRQRKDDAARTAAIGFFAALPEA